MSDAGNPDRKYVISDFQQFHDSVPPSTTASRNPKPVVDDIVIGPYPDGLSDRIKAVIETGDDPDRPRNTQNPRFPSRSEAVMSAACGMARYGLSDLEIASVLCNADYRISESVLEKSNPRDYALRQAEKAILFMGNLWPDGEAGGTPRKTFQNTKAALLRTGASFALNLFSMRYEVSGAPISDGIAEANDRIISMLRDFLTRTFGFDPGKEMIRDSVEQLCIEASYHPIKEYLHSLVWDGTPRIETFLVDYAGAEDTAFNRSVSRLMFIAAVRRVMDPGVKFDFLIVLEGVQGSGKSTLIKLLAGEKYFSDQDLLALDTRAQIEALEGVWIFEICELSGLRHADVNKVKAFISRAVDKARLAYARYSEARPRQCIFIGTTNDDAYLKDKTGNRRFWPVSTGRIDLEAIKRDRDQFWAEAIECDRQGMSIDLPKELWAEAAAQQDMRLEEDGWLPLLQDLTGEVFGGKEIISSRRIMSDKIKVSSERIAGFHWNRLSRVMKQLGWNGPKTLRFPGEEAPQKGYWRDPPQKEMDLHR